MSRFSSDEHLTRYLETGVFPDIHRPMVEAVQWACPADARFIDLGACFGLLGAAVLTLRPGAFAIGVERSARAIEDGQRAGVPMQCIRLDVRRETLPDLVALVRRFRVNTILARRVLPELWGEDIEGGRMFAQSMRGAGVRQVIIEGRKAVASARNNLASVELEAAIMRPHYREAGRPAGRAAIIVLERA